MPTILTGRTSITPTVLIGRTPIISSFFLKIDSSHFLKIDSSNLLVIGTTPGTFYSGRPTI